MIFDKIRKFFRDYYNFQKELNKVEVEDPDDQNQRQQYLFQQLYFSFENDEDNESVESIESIMIENVEI